MEMDGGRIDTPYGAMTTPEVVAARRSLAALVASDEAAAAGPLGDLLVWSTIELAERVSAFVEHVDGAVFGVALEALALDTGIVRGERRMPPQRPPATRAPEPPTTPVQRHPVPLRRSGRRRG